ncbi:TerC family protein [Kangiella sp. TOML190]|uniref:TerC family protein n=1 Tax=Kangiella sp. TOML190 TaxID=2931351 RepID=UPI00203F256D|nr:TerC family protein [Kangiella sp. TOML190]
MDLFTIENLFTLMMLIVLQAVLGFDNLLYISLESKRAPAADQKRVRRLGIGIAVVLRIVLLFSLMKLIDYVQGELFSIQWQGVVEGTFTFESLIVLFGGVFIMYTAVKEIWHMMALEVGDTSDRKPQSAAKIIALIVMMNLVFSFDSILSAMALTDNFWIMAIAIISSGIAMIWLADTVSNFLEKNRMFEVLGLFILLIVGVMLLADGGHKSHLMFFGNEITPMSKATFYFVIAVLVLSDIVQSRYQKNLLRKKQRLAEKAGVKS